MSEDTRTKAEIIEERKANLPLPDQPPQPSDWNSMSESINVDGAKVREEELHNPTGDSEGLREPASVDSDVRSDGSVTGTGTAGSGVGRQAVEGLSGPPSDAVTADKRDNAATSDTMGKDYGYSLPFFLGARPS